MAKFEPQNKNPRIGNEIREEQPTRTSTPVRNTPVPRPQQSSGRREISHEQIAKRAYEISISGSGGSELENWLRAERELKGQ
jgi:hypothetical protein